MEIEGLTMAKKVVLIVLANHLNEQTGQCFPSLDRIARHAACNERTVRRAITDLETDGLIRVERSSGRSAHNYAILTDREAPNVDTKSTLRESRSEAGQPGLSVHQPGLSVHSNMDSVSATRTLCPSTRTQSPPNQKEPEKEPLEEPPPNQRARGEPPPLELVPPSPRKKPREEDPTEAAVEIWNLVCGKIGNGVVSKITDGRRSALRARMREDFHNDLVEWRRYCEDISLNAFLTGGGERGWRADFDWALKPGNVVKVREGKFSDAPRAPPKPSNLDFARRLYADDDEPPPIDTSDFIDLDPGDYREA